MNKTVAATRGRKMRLRGWKKYGVGAGGTLVLAMAILLATGWGSAVAAQVSSVFITNDAAHPVPVQEQRADANGNIKVHEQGTANVQVQGTPSVNVANGLVPTTQAGTPAEIELGQTFDTDRYTVPAGKRLIVNFISASANTASGIDWITVDAGRYDLLGGGSGFHRYVFLMKHSQVRPDLLFLNQPFQLVLNAGQDISNASHAEFMIIAGWLVDA